MKTTKSPTNTEARLASELMVNSLAHFKIDSVRGRLSTSPRKNGVLHVVKIPTSERSTEAVQAVLQELDHHGAKGWSVFTGSKGAVTGVSKLL